MIIRCPKCRTGYSIKEDQISGAGRMVRCSQCAHTWHQEEIKKDATPETKNELPPIAPVNEAFNKDIFAKDPAVEQQKKKMRIIALTSFISTALILSVFLLAQSFFENIFPSSKSFYSAIGLSSEQAELTESATGLIIPKDKIERTLEDGDPIVLTFKGIVVNTNSVQVSVPKIIVTLHDDKGVEIDRWPAYPEKSQLAAGEETVWICRFFNPDLDSVSEHRIRFK